MNKVYFGKYIATNSYIHNFHAFLKFLLILSMILFISIIKSVALLSILLIVVLVTAKISKIKINILISYVKPFLILLIFTFLLQLFFTIDGHLKFDISNLNYSILYTMRFLMIILLSAILTITSSPFDLVRIIYLMLKPLKVFKVSVEELAITSVLAIRFIPLIFEEAEKIKIAQKIRGENRSFIQNLFRIEDFIIPLLNRIFYFAEQISITLMYKRDWEKILKFNFPNKKEFFLFVMLEIFILVGCIYV
ncbi:energy-coupling factor transporter transmembrane protein EcfT [Deferribacter thermophilus]|uniref:energy-coupling factor transporter transmembrane component T family protein n=1 Tax=Deferribacter thermophilus TaxID=53573 RepID=UPI003C19ED9C